MTKVLGKHTIKFGGHFIDVITTNYFIQRVRGDYEYSTLEQYLQDLTPDVLGERSAGPTSYPAGFLQNAAFVNDDYRILPNLTLNLGLALRVRHHAGRLALSATTALQPTSTVASPLPIRCSAQPTLLRELGLPTRPARTARGPSVAASASLTI